MNQLTQYRYACTQSRICSYFSPPLPPPFCCAAAHRTSSPAPPSKDMDHWTNALVIVYLREHYFPNLCCPAPPSDVLFKHQALSRTSSFKCHGILSSFLKTPRRSGLFLSLGDEQFFAVPEINAPFLFEEVN